MTNLIDKALAYVLREHQASAANCRYEYRCPLAGGWYRRRCCSSPGGVENCYSWVRIGSVCATP
ncbi:hypothetical protein [Nonomuraea dietziae]|jgi:hypothetical protein|uniref:hypothetical protein n=1 Tax=Nonomuraea dietziae TaxID=65515 RepID=UPI0034257710